MRSPIKSVSRGGRLNLFLLEMIIVLLFFSIASAVILKAFVAADRMSAENMRLERMAFCAQSAAEIFSETGDIAETAEILFEIDSERFEGATRIDIPLDEKCGYSYLKDASLFMTMKITESEYEGRFKAMNISFTDDEGNMLYEINAASYIPERTVLFDEE